MSKVYVALQAIGAFDTGEVVTGLTDERIKVFLEAGAIEERDADDVADGGDIEETGLKKLTIPQLKDLLDEKGIKYKSGDDKTALINLIEDNTGG